MISSLKSAMLVILILLQSRSEQINQNPNAVEALKDTRKRLASSEVEIRKGALSETKSLILELRHLLPLLEDLLAKGDEECRIEAARTIAAYGPLASQSLPRLREAIRDSSPKVRLAVIGAIGEIRPFSSCAIPELIESTHDSDKEVTMRAVATLGMIGPPARASVPRLVEILKGDPTQKNSSHCSLPESAAASLGAIGPEAKMAIPALLNLLKAEDPGIRISAMFALGDISRGEEEVISQLIGIAKKETDILIRGNVAQALGRMGPSGKEGVPILIELLKLKPPKNDTEKAQSIVAARESAAWALGQMGKEAGPEVVKVLTSVLLDPDSPMVVRQRAAYSLGDLGPEVAKEGIPALVKVRIDDKNNQVHQAASAGLVAMGKAGVPHLVKILNSGDAREQEHALEILRFLGPAAGEALDVIKEKLNSEDPAIAREAAGVVYAIEKKITIKECKPSAHQK